MLAIKPASGKPFLRTSPELENEIGDKAGKLLLQLDYWIRIGKNFVNEQWWTYQSTRDIQEKAFPGWALSTINRTVKKLEELGLIEIANFNKAKYDKTRWFALKAEGLARLKSVVLLEDEPRPEQIEPRSDQNGTHSAQNGTGSTQNGTTIPMISTENSSMNSALTTTSTPAARAVDADVPKPAALSENVDHFKAQIPEVRPVEASDEGNDELIHPPTPDESPRLIPPVAPFPPAPDDETDPDCVDDVKALRMVFTGKTDNEVKALIEKHGAAKIYGLIKGAATNSSVKQLPGFVLAQLEKGVGGQWRLPKVTTEDAGDKYTSGPFGHLVNRYRFQDEQDPKRYITGKYADFIES